MVRLLSSQVALLCISPGFISCVASYQCRFWMHCNKHAMVFSVVSRSKQSVMHGEALLSGTSGLGLGNASPAGWVPGSAAPKHIVKPHCVCRENVSRPLLFVRLLHCNQLLSR
jgi:hypothetical protein